MIPLSLRQIADLVGGELYDVEDPNVLVTGFVEFDSRKITPGGLFLALPGTRVDGHDFAAAAVAAGAVAVLAARPVGVPAIVVKPTPQQGSNAEIFAHDQDGSAAAVVGALSRLARAVIDELTAHHGLSVIGITGSAGKTSTKDLVASIMRVAGPTVAPPGSFNNEIGHPYTALRCETETRFFVAELSARGIGHINHLTEIAPPLIGVELNVGSAHLGEFGSQENIAQAKGELIEALPAAAQGGIAVLNADDEYVAAMANGTAARVMRFSTTQPPAADVEVWASEIRLDSLARPSFRLHARDEESQEVSLNVFGAHQVSNALAAAAVGRAVGLPLAQIAAALGAHTSASVNRMDVHTRGDGVTIINDTYNANPDSMRAGIAALAYTAAGREHITSLAILGEMGELGPGSVAEHERVAADLVRFQISHLIAVGDSPGVLAMANYAAAHGIITERVIDNATAVAQARQLLQDNDVVLVKASHAQQLWQVAEELLV